MLKDVLHPIQAFLLTFAANTALGGEVSPDILSAPWDVIIATDNSASMDAENAALVDRLYPDLVQPLQEMGMDLQVIVLGRFGTGSADLCFENPLGAIPFGACAFNPPGLAPANTPDFKHYSVSNQSFNTWCQMLRTYNGDLVDEFFLHPSGWSVWLRPNAFKQIIVLSDDRIECTLNMESFSDFPVTSAAAAGAAASSFDAAILSLSSTQFGTATNRRYMLHGVVGVDEQSGRPGGLRLPSDSLNVLNSCSTAARPGGGNQALSRLTEGLRFPICQFFVQPALFFEALIQHPRIFSGSFENP